jgi:TetR/AcrR family transcriptional regulator
MKNPSSKSIRQDQAEHTRAAILLAASHEFAINGFNGASTVAIMEAAGVNTSLLFYYFGSKKGLYKAVFLNALEEVTMRTTDGLLSPGTPGERLLRAALNHFDRFVTHREAQSIMQQEMLRDPGGKGELMQAFERGLFAPWIETIQRTIHEGIASGELREMHWNDIFSSILAVNAQYFLTAPVIGLAFGHDPLAPPALVERRERMARFWGAALFADSTQGAALASRVLAEMPMPARTRPAGREKKIV